MKFGVSMCTGDCRDLPNNDLLPGNQISVDHCSQTSHVKKNCLIHGALDQLIGLQTDNLSPPSESPLLELKKLVLMTWLLFLRTLKWSSWACDSCASYQGPMSDAGHHWINLCPRIEAWRVSFIIDEIVHIEVHNGDGGSGLWVSNWPQSRL